jgi:hypothetical protein
MKKLIILGLLSSSLACSKEFKANEDIKAPSINILAPQSFELKAGDTLKIEVEIRDNDQLHDYYLGLNNLSEMKKEIHWSGHWHGQSIRLDTNFIIPSELPFSHWQLQLEASDHYGNRKKVRKEIFILGH